MNIFSDVTRRQNRSFESSKCLHGSIMKKIRRICSSETTATIKHSLVHFQKEYTELPSS